MKKTFLTIVIAGILIAGCAHKGVVKETGQSRQVSATDQNKQSDAQANKKISQETISSKESSNTQQDSMLLKQLQAKTGDIHFDFDRYLINTDDKPILKQVADTLRKNGNLKVVIEGNCDEKGTTEYNLALGDRRAVAAREYLLSQGIQSGRMDTVSNGKEKPLCAENNEACWAKNRRDHFVFEVSKH